MRDEVLRVKADVALGFDGDGDRCGVVDNEGEEIFADKVGVMLARDISARHKGAKFVADVKSTGLFMTDPVLRNNGATTDYWKTGHSYMKRRVNEIGAVAGLRNPVTSSSTSRSVAATTTASSSRLRSDMLDRNPDKSMADLRNALPKTWSSQPCPRIAPTRSNTVVDDVVKHFETAKAKGRRSRGNRCAIWGRSTACA